MSYQGINVREAFVARSGYYFIDVDYSQIEFRLGAALAGERSLIKGFLAGNDYYKMVYANMAGKNADDVTGEERALGKILALGQAYGQEENGLALKLKCAKDRAKLLMAQYWDGMPATKRAKEAALNKALQDGYVRTWFGRERPLPDLFSKDRRIQGKGRRSVWNTIIQGTAADWLKLAMVRAHRGLAGRDAYILLTIHDELLFEVSEQEPLIEISQIIKEAMEFKVPKLPVGMPDLYPDGFWVPTDMTYGYDWGHQYYLDDELDKHGNIKKHKKTGEELIGFRTVLKQMGRYVNLDVPKEPAKYSFVAVPNTDEIVTIAARQKHVADEKVMTNVSAINGKHPLDLLFELTQQLAGGKVWTPPPSRQLELPVTEQKMSANDLFAKFNADNAAMDNAIESEVIKPVEPEVLQAAADAEPQVDAEVEARKSAETTAAVAKVLSFEDFKKQAQAAQVHKPDGTLLPPNEEAPVGSYMTQVIESPKVDAKIVAPGEVARAGDTVQVGLIEAEVSTAEIKLEYHPPVPVASPAPPVNGTNGHNEAPKVDNQPLNDYTYPCVVIRAREQINTKQLSAAKNLFGKLPGTHWVFIEYMDKVIRAGDKYKVDPNPTFLTYVKKIFANAETVVYDSPGGPGRGKIDFV